jgi:PAS domain S-box-containing protein
MAEKKSVPAHGKRIRELELQIETLKTSERCAVEQWRLIAEATSDYILVLDRDLKITYVNRSELGLNKQELIGKPLPDLAPVSSRDMVEQILTEVLKTGQSTSYFTEFKRPSDEIVCFDSIASAIITDGEVTGITVISRNITKRRGSKDALLETERRRSQETVRNIATGVSAQIGKALFQSQVAHLAKIFDAEYTYIGLLDEQKPDLIETVALCIHGEIVDNLSYHLANTPCENVVRRAHAHICAYPRDLQGLFPEGPHLKDAIAQSYVGAPLFDANDKPIGLIVVMDDKPMEKTEEVKTVLQIFAARAAGEIERIRAEEELRKSQEMLKLILDSIPVRVFWKDLDSVYLGCNKHFAEDAGLESPEQIIGMNDFELSWGDQAELYQSDDRQVMQSGVSKLDYEEPQSWPDGTQLWLRTSKSPLRNVDGAVFGVLGVYEDITKRKLTEMVLRESEQRLADAQRMAHIGNWELDLVTNKLEWSEEIHRVFETDPQTFAPSYEGFLELVHPSDRKGVGTAYSKSVKDKTPYSIEHRLRMPDGRVKHVHERCQTFYDDDGNPIRSIGTVQDITERVKMEEALRRSQKMDAIGQLSGGIAHDFNNQLGVIIGYLDFLKEHFPEDEEPSQWVDIATRATLRCTDLTRQLLTFTRNHSKEPVSADLNIVLKDLETMVARTVTPEVEVQYSLADGLWRTDIDPGEFQDTILNLVLNARDAMPGGGTILIETTNKFLDTDYAALNPELKSGDYVQLMMGDTGTGMDKETLEHLFEPFFTSKPEGKGTGLGMAMVYGFVERHGGNIKIFSELGTGTTVRIFLPRSTAAESAIIGNDSREASLPTGHESILIVDDEVALLELADRYLGNLGYRTCLAENAMQALTILAGEEEFDLLFSDVVMPGGMNGYELAKQATEQRPCLKVLLTSGFTSANIANNGLARFSAHLLSKPYGKVDLARRIRLVLDGGANEERKSVKGSR